MCVCLCIRMSGGVIFRTRSDRPWVTPSLPYNEYRVFLGVRRPGRDVDHPHHLAPRLNKEYRYTSTPLRTFVAFSRLNFSFTSNFTCMDEWMECYVCVCVFVHACIHTHMYKSMRECLRMCYLRLCLYVWIYVRRNVCVYTFHIYAFRLYSGAVFHGSGTFILRSTDGY